MEIGIEEKQRIEGRDLESKNMEEINQQRWEVFKTAWRFGENEKKKEEKHERLEAKQSLLEKRLLGMVTMNFAFSFFFYNHFTLFFFLQTSWYYLVDWYRQHELLDCFSESDIFTYILSFSPI